MNLSRRAGSLLCVAVALLFLTVLGSTSFVWALALYIVAQLSVDGLGLIRKERRRRRRRRRS